MPSFIITAAPPACPLRCQVFSRNACATVWQAARQYTEFRKRYQGTLEEFFRALQFCVVLNGKGKKSQGKSHTFSFALLSFTRCPRQRGNIPFLNCHLLHLFPPQCLLLVANVSAIDGTGFKAPGVGRNNPEFARAGLVQEGLQEHIGLRKKLFTVTSEPSLQRI